MKNLATLTRLPLVTLVATAGIAGAQPAKAPPPKAVAAAQVAPAHAVVVHIAPITTEPGTPIELEAMIDAPFAEQLSVRWRAVGEAKWEDTKFERSSAGGWFASLPSADARGVEYYIRGADSAGTEIEHFASLASPHIVRVDPSLFDRLEALDVDRLAGRRNEVALDITGHDFGNRYDIKDRFLRTELIYSYKLLRQLHEIGFGFGSISGNTPESEDPMADALLKGTRYGFGQARLRVHPSVFLDGRFGLGVSHEEFQANGRAAITFGKPWRSCVQVGGEYFGDLGPSAFVRLQWDTAPPVLMGASIVRTDLPGVEIDVAGLYIAYDIQYRVANQFTLRGQLSYGARDGAAHIGGGLGTAVAF
jgi:hypothetical protein